jgi:hypothetical protein
MSACVVLAGPTTLLTAPLSGAYASGSLVPGNLLVSKSTYPTPGPSITPGSTLLPPGCTGTACKAAVADGTYPYVFNNAGVDPGFGVTSPIVLNQLTPSGAIVNSLTVPNSTLSGVTASSDQMVTSFTSKSELALNLSTDKQNLTFMGYNAPVDGLDVSNSNTATAPDPTNPIKGSDYRVVAQLDQSGNLQFTESNAYSGNNGRAAILNSGGNVIYTAGNAGNGANPEPMGVVLGVGSQILTPAYQPESAQTPGQATPLGNFNITQLGAAADKSAKDDNFRGITINNNVLYYTKGSGSNGVNTVYFVDTAGACSGGTSLPASGATLPTASSVSYSTSSPSLGLTTANPGLTPTNMCILKGFPTALARTATNASDFPFGVWFANPTTLYVGDEGAGDATFSTTTNTYTAAAASTTAGLQKWVLNSSTNQWNLAYTLQSGLNLGQPYTVPGYPTGNNTTQGGKGGPWAPASDGLRNITGQVNADGTVTVWGVTSTVSGSGDQGTDPNQLVSITDQVAATSLPGSETFQTVIQPTAATVVRGVSFTPGTGAPGTSIPEVPWTPLIPLSAIAIGAAMLQRRRRHSTSAAA